MLPSLLANLEPECALMTTEEFKAKGIEIFTDTAVKVIEDDSHGGKAVVCEKQGNEIVINTQFVLLSTGRKPNIKDIGLEEVGVKLARGFVSTDKYMKTSVPNIYAAGDVTGKCLLAHAAYEQGSIAIENMLNKSKEFSLKAIPKVVFLDTEISSVGMCEAEAKQAGYDVLIGRFDLKGNGKALSMGKAGGFIKVVSENKNHEILGIHVAGPGASELVTIAVSLITMEAILEDVATAVYPHPSVSEAIREACMDALGYAVHG